MKKFKLLLLDANVVTKAFELGLWQQLIERCDIWIASTVIQEAEFFVSEDGISHPIDLKPDIVGNRISRFEVSLSELSIFRELFDPSYLEKLDDCETESLAFLLNSSEQFLICSADKIVYRILGNLKRSEQGVSLEKVLRQVSLGVCLPRQFTKSYREEWATKGLQEGLGGLGYKGDKAGKASASTSASDPVLRS
jgi:hypothetical protein